MPLTRQHIEGERPMRKRHLDEETVIRKEDIQQFLADYERMNRAKETVQFYRRKLKRFYEDLPEDKIVRYNTPYRNGGLPFSRMDTRRDQSTHFFLQQTLTWIISGIVSTSWQGT